MDRLSNSLAEHSLCLSVSERTNNSHKGSVSDISISVNIFNKHAFRLMYSMQDQVNKSNITVLIIMTRFSIIPIYVRWDIIKGAI